MSPVRHPGFALLALVVATLTPPADGATVRVLFLGNSLTAGNNVPALVKAMAKLGGVDLEYSAVHPGGYALEDHWADGNQARLAQENFDVLVLQQGPSTLPDSQANLRAWTITWAAEARRHGTRPALYMIWPVRTQANGFTLVSQSYRNAAFAADTAVFPAGEAWEKVLQSDPSLALYSGDDLHATATGSFLAAMVIARGLVGLDPARVPTSVNGITIPTATLTLFRRVVDALPAATLTDQPVPIPDSSSAPAVPPTTALAASGGGGGATSLWFVFALAALGAARRFRLQPGR